MTKYHTCEHANTHLGLVHWVSAQIHQHTAPWTHVYTSTLQNIHSTMIKVFLKKKKKKSLPERNAAPAGKV